MVSWCLLQLCLHFKTQLWPCFAAGHCAAAVHPRGGAEAVGPGEGRVQRPGHLAGHRGGEWGSGWPRAAAQALVLPWGSTKVVTTGGLPAASPTNPCTDIALQRQSFSRSGKLQCTLQHLQQNMELLWIHVGNNCSGSILCTVIRVYDNHGT